jgi:radical SAM superfamily enzyme YgiQ (UPF0313 family)
LEDTVLEGDVMDVVLVQPRNKLSRDISGMAHLPIGLLSVATPLDIAGYQVRIIDQRTEYDWEASLLSELKTDPVCVGISVTTGPQIWWALKASELVKQNSEVPVVWGGVHPSLLPKQTLEHPYIDFIVQGEGEETFYELVTALGNKTPLNRINGIWYKENNHVKQNPSRDFIDLNKQPPLSYHLIDLDTHMMSILGVGALLMETSRGCPFNCAFCYNTCFNKRRWRAFTAEETLSRMKRAKDVYGVNAFVFSDDNFFVEQQRTHRILEGLIKQMPDIIWGKGDIRLDFLSKLDDEFLRLIERSGCEFLAIGVESGSERIAEIMRKEIDISQVIPANQRLIDYRMAPHYAFLLGIPGETKTDLAKTASMMLTLVDENQKATNGVSVFIPYPGTELYDLSVECGFLQPQRLEDWIHLGWMNRRADYPWLSTEMMRCIQMLSFCGIFLAKDRSMNRFTGDISPFISYIAKLYHPIARKRVKGLHSRFLPEFWMAELLGFRGY